MAYMTGTWKLMLGNANPTELYYLSDDPGEHHNLIVTREEQKNALFKEYDRYTKTTPGVFLEPTPKYKMDEEKRKKLIQQGYF